MICAKKYDESAQSYDTWVEYVYCPSCGGAMTERIEYSDAGTTVSSWLRYQYEGLNLLRIDERYDGSDAGTAINEGDPWRPVNVFVHGPGQIGQIVKCSIYDGGWVDDVYYHYDALGNVMGYSDSNANAVTFEMDAFGQAVPAPMVSVTCFNCDRVENRTIGALNDYGFKENINSFYWKSMTSIGPKEHLTGKMLDDDTGLYYFHARWYDPQVGRFIGRDPAKESDGSQYMFALDNPILLVDPTGAMTGGIPPNFYNTNPGEAKPCCSASEATQDWQRMIWAMFQKYPRTFISCASNNKLVLGFNEHSKCWDCSLELGKKPSLNPMTCLAGSFMKAVHQWGDCRLKTANSLGRPTRDPRNPILDHWHGSNTSGMSGFDMAQCWPLPADK